jgi:hypothetical protein
VASVLPLVSQVASGAPARLSVSVVRDFETGGILI